MSVRILPAGDSAWLIELPERIDAAVNTRAIRIAHAVEAAGLPVTDVVVGYRSVMVYVDPLVGGCRGGRGTPARAGAAPSGRRGRGPARSSRCRSATTGPMDPTLATWPRSPAVLDRGGDRAAPGARVPRVRRRLRAGLCLHGAGRSADRRAAPDVAAAEGPRGIGRRRRRPDRRVSGRNARRLEPDRPLPDQAVRRRPRRAVPVSSGRPGPLPSHLRNCVPRHHAVGRRQRPGQTGVRPGSRAGDRGQTPDARLPYSSRGC